MTTVVLGYAPAGLTLPTFAAHTQAFLTDWLADFAWHGTPLAGAIARITGTAHATTTPDVTSPNITLWTNPGNPWLTPDRVDRVADPAVVDAMLDDPFHEHWEAILDAYGLTGTWLHPDTQYDTDPYSWATGRAAFAVGTRDRNNPDAPRRYNPDLRCDTNDLGVVYFPVRAQWRAPDWIADGHRPDRTCLYIVGTALAEAGVHEAMEMHQDVPGHPIWDPHDRGYRLTLTVHFADGTTALGTAH